MTYTFTHEMVDPADDALLTELYELGKANPSTTNICSQYPYALKADLQQTAERGHLAAIYEDGFGLRGYVGFTPEGRIVSGSAIHYEPTGMDLSHPGAIAFNQYLYTLPAQVVGQSVVETRNNEYADYVKQFGVETPNQPEV